MGIDPLNFIMFIPFTKSLKKLRNLPRTVIFLYDLFTFECIALEIMTCF